MRWLWREIQRRRRGDYLAVTTNYDLFSLKMLPEMTRVFVNILNIGRWKKQIRTFEIRKNCQPNGAFLDPPWARVILRSALVKESVEAATVKAVWMDECGMDKFKLLIWEAIQRRLALNEGRALGTTTIYNRAWLKTEVYDRWKAGDETFDVVQFESRINPVFPEAEYLRMEGILPTWKMRMYYQGLFDKPPGLIYDVFERERHVCPSFPIPRDWPRVVGIDPIGVYTAAIWLAWDTSKGKLHAYKEYYQPYGRTTREHTTAILAECTDGPVIAFVGGAVAERQSRLDWNAAGMPLQPPPHSNVESGISTIYALLKGGFLVVHDSCPHLISELSSYSRAMDDNDEVLAKIVGKDSYHVLDSTRYATSWLANPGEQETIVYEPAQVLPAWLVSRVGAQYGIG